jgi:hypothetical protein
MSASVAFGPMLGVCLIVCAKRGVSFTGTAAAGAAELEAALADSPRSSEARCGLVEVGDQAAGSCARKGRGGVSL